MQGGGEGNRLLVIGLDREVDQLTGGPCSDVDAVPAAASVVATGAGLSPGCRAAACPSMPACPLLQVHAGFLSAWLHHGFSEKVLARLRELDSGQTPLRFWVCGAWLVHLFWQLHIHEYPCLPTAPLRSGTLAPACLGCCPPPGPDAIQRAATALRAAYGRSSHSTLLWVPFPSISGHSLGGALATLAALRIRQQHPTSQLTVLTYGCPRVRRQNQ